MPRSVSHIKLAVVYHPPKSDDWAMCQHLVSTIDKIKQKHLHSGFIVLADFNHMKDHYLQCAANLTQLVKKPMHSSAMIDLFYTDISDLFMPPQHEPGIGLSHHQVIMVTPDSSYKSIDKPTFIKIHKHGPSDRTALQRALSKVDWTPMCHLNSVKQQINMFLKVITYLTDQFLPERSVKRNSHDKLWVTDEFRRLITLRQHHFHAGNET